jgi:hypothetical protein
MTENEEKNTKNVTILKNMIYNSSIFDMIKELNNYEETTVKLDKQHDGYRISISANGRRIEQIIDKHYLITNDDTTRMVNRTLNQIYGSLTRKITPKAI